MNPDDKYCLFNRDNLTQPIQILLSKKQKILCQFFSAFLKSKFNFEHFAKKMTLIADGISQIRDSEKAD